MSSVINIAFKAITEGFDKAVQKVGEQTKRLKANIEKGSMSFKSWGAAIKQGVTPMISNAISSVGGLGKAIGAAFKGALGPVALVVAAIEAGIAVFDDLKESSQAFGDFVTKTFKQLGAVISYALNPKNWNEDFLQGIEQVWQAAGELADKMDEVGTRNIEFAAEQQRLKTIIAETQEVMSSETSTLEEKNKAIKDGTQAVERLKEITSDYSKTLRENADAQLKEILASRGIVNVTKEERDEVLKLLGTYKGTDKLVAMGGVFAQIADAISDTNQETINKLVQQADGYEREVAQIAKRANSSYKIKPQLIIEKDSINALQKAINDKKVQLNNLRIGSPAFKAIEKDIKDLESRLNTLQDIEILPSLKLPVKDVTKDLQLIGQVATTTAKQTKSLSEQLEGVANINNQLANFISVVGQESKGAAIAMQAFAIATEVAAFASAILKQTERDPYSMIAGVISTTAAITSGIIAIHQLSRQAFANGGIVAGQYDYGDKQLVAVNSGEMILTKQQQANLFRQLNSPNSTISGDVEFKIRGEDLVGVLKAYNKYNNRTL